MPTAFFILELDFFGVTGNALFGGGLLRGFQRGRVGRERFGEYAVGLVSPAAIVFDDFVGNLGHATPLGLEHDLRAPT